MPIYEYKCQLCGHTFEQLVFHEATRPQCPRCQGRVEKLMSLFSFEMPDEICGKLPKGQERELCTECKHGGSSCPGVASAASR